MEKLLELLRTQSGSIVSSASLTPLQIAMASSNDRMHIDKSGLGFIWLPEAPGSLPSRFKHDDVVKLDFKEAGCLSGARIIKVHFTERKIQYDVEIRTLSFLANESTRLYNIDSNFVEPA